MNSSSSASASVSASADSASLAACEQSLRAWARASWPRLPDLRLGPTPSAHAARWPGSHLFEESFRSTRSAASRSSSS
eukprot:scaffold29927_cov23-Tisochrysis_lutea.AAC.4